MGAGDCRHWPRSEILRALRPMFEPFPADILLRGSAAREDTPYDDLDIAVITTRDRAVVETMPARLGELPVHYSHLPRRLLRDFFATYPRCWDLAVDGIALREHDPGVADELARQRVVMYEQRLADTVLFVLQEDDVEPRRPGTPADYRTRKRLPGSRHTITRCVFLLRAMYPELRRLPTTAELLAAAEHRRVAPAGIGQRVRRVQHAIRDPAVPLDALRVLFEPITAWVADLRRQAWPIVEQATDPAYLAALSQASQPLHGPAGQLLADYALGLARSSHRLVLLSTLPANSDLPADTIMMLWQRFRHDTVHRALLRRLARHPRFPVGEEANSALSADDLTLTRDIRAAREG